MLKKLLDKRIMDIIEKNFDTSFIYEVRIRVNSPIVINFKGLNVCLRDESLNLAIASRSDVERVVSVACNYSLYTVDNQIKQAFITAEKGYRIGLSGEMIVDFSGGVKNLKNIYSVNIRIPHDLPNVSVNIYKLIKTNDGIKNTLIISPPGAGKTTFLRDICYQMSKECNPINVLLLDERYEIAGVKDGVPTINLGGFCDILSGSSKDYGFYQGVRALKPDVIMTDEIATKNDVDGVMYAINSGVKVVATIHADGIDMLREKKSMDELMINRAFERYVVLSNKNGPGKCDGVYDENFKCLYY